MDTTAAIETLEESLNPENALSAQEVISTLTSTRTSELIGALALLVVLLIISHYLTRLVAKQLTRTTRISKSLHTVLVTMLRYLLILLSVMIAANTVGIPISTFLALFSVLGIAISLAIQGVLSNIAGCMILLSGKMFEVDDYIETPSGSGTVKEINLMNTKLLDPEGKYIFIPNSALYTATVTNVTSYQKRRMALSFKASADHSPERVRAAVFEAITHFPAILTDPAPALNVAGYSAGHVNYTLLAWTKTADYWPTRNGLTEQLYTSMKAHDIDMTNQSISIVASDS
ncbi:MAG: mechanosensitive ion channel family protein [Clostridia bacterium]|nr:mechanosensitive ion channel family protein [Clostridia bacterium]